MQAHNRFTPRQIMHEITIGQVFVMFEGMAEYVKFTNPWGSGETQKPTTDVDASQAAFDAVNSGAFAAAQPVHIDNLDPSLRALLLDDSED